MTTASDRREVDRPRLGRPRDRALHQKIIESAIECYAERGWSGFNFETVSARASVGRAALYRRWPDREALLIDAFRESTHQQPPVDRSDVREEIVDIAFAHRQILMGARGRAGIRLTIERHAAPEVFATVSAEITTQRDVRILEALERGRSRGEIRADADLDIAHRLLVGAVTVDAIDGDKTPQQTRAIVEKIVDVLLHGILPAPTADRDL